MVTIDLLEDEVYHSVRHPKEAVQYTMTSDYGICIGQIIKDLRIDLNFNARNQGFRVIKIQWHARQRTSSMIHGFMEGTKTN
jgi:hypothetical protein